MPIVDPAESLRNTAEVVLRILRILRATQDRQLFTQTGSDGVWRSETVDVHQDDDEP